MNQTQKNYLWNMLAGMVNAAEAVVLSIIVTRVTGIVDAGILAIAFSIGNLLVCIGKFGVYNFQVTDVNDEYSFLEYFKFRIVTTLLMLIAIIAYCIRGHFFLQYDSHKTGCIFLIGLIYAIEAIEDVFCAYYQKINRLDFGGKTFCIRWGTIFISFMIGIVVLRDMFLTLIISTVVSLVSFLLFQIIVFPHNCCMKEKSPAGNKNDDKNYMLKLVKSVFPLFLSAFLSFYVFNAPKYAIDAVLNDEMQACYSFVAMPVFVIGLLNSFIYHPSLVDMSTEWNDGKKDLLSKRIVRQMIIIVALSVCCFLGAAVVGIPVLSWIYHTNLSGYYMELIILQIAGGFLGISGYLSVILTIMRCQKDLIWGYVFITIISFVSMKTIAINYGTKGVAVEFTMMMAMLVIVYTVNLIFRWKRN